MKFCQIIKRDRCMTRQAQLKSHPLVQEDFPRRIFSTSSEEEDRLEEWEVGEVSTSRISSIKCLEGEARLKVKEAPVREPDRQV
jgi:hypothetical protein